MRLISRWLDLAVIAGITALAALVSQSWPGFNSPDSEFYASLALYGSDVVARAIEPSYIWTRLGYVAPVRTLILIFGPWIAFEMWRIFLIFVITAAVYSMARIAGRPRALGSVLALFTALNTVVLAFAGNTYLTGTVMAGIFCVIALGVWFFGTVASHNRGLFGWPRWTAAVLVGGILAFILMTNPYGAILAGGTWLVLRITALILLRKNRWACTVRDLLWALAGFSATFGAFLVTGAVIFPGRNWVATYLDWNSRLDYTVFIGDATTWQRDTALLVVASALIASIAAACSPPARRWAWAALGTSGTTVALTVLLMIVFTGPWLESPTYVALLFPGALSSFALIFIALTPGTYEAKGFPNWLWGSASLVGAPLLIFAGHYEGALGRTLGWVITLALTGVFALLVVLVGCQSKSERISFAVTFVMLVALVGTYVGSQLLQNGRGLLGIYGQYPFAAAYQDYKGRNQMEAKIKVQNWLLASTSPSDSIAIWTDPAGLGASTAAMQMWGGDNLATLDATLDRNASNRLAHIEPTIIAMYSPHPELIRVFFESLPPWSLPSELECMKVNFPVVESGEMHACISRLTWVG